MKSILIIGMGRMGRHLARKMLELGNEVMVVDKNPAVIESISTAYTDKIIGDCTNRSVIHDLGVNNFDICFVTIGTDFQSSLVVTSLLKQYGARMIISKAKQDIQADLLKQIGADEIVYPEREVAEKLAVRYNSKNIFDFVRLTSEYSIYEIPVLSAWLGHTVEEVDVRKKYNINIIAVKNGNDLQPIPGGEHRFVQNDHIIVIGQSTDVFRLASKT